MFNSRLVFACAFSIMLWEQIISFREEYTVVWQTGVKWSLAKAVFVLNRYLAIIGLTLYVVSTVRFPSLRLSPLNLDHSRDMATPADLVYFPSDWCLFPCPLAPNGLLPDQLRSRGCHPGVTRVRFMGQKHVRSISIGSRPARVSLH